MIEVSGLDVIRSPWRIFKHNQVFTTAAMSATATCSAYRICLTWTILFRNCNRSREYGLSREPAMHRALRQRNRKQPYDDIMQAHALNERLSIPFVLEIQVIDRDEPPEHLPMSMVF